MKAARSGWCSFQGERRLGSGEEEICRVLLHSKQVMRIYIHMDAAALRGFQLGQSPLQQAVELSPVGGLDQDLKAVIAAQPLQRRAGRSKNAQSPGIGQRLAMVE